MRITVSSDNRLVVIHPVIGELLLVEESKPVDEKPMVSPPAGLEKYAPRSLKLRSQNQRFPLWACAKLVGMLKLCNFNSYQGPCGGLLLIDGWAATCKCLAPKCYPTEWSVLADLTK